MCRQQAKTRVINKESKCVKVLSGIKRMSRLKLSFTKTTESIGCDSAHHDWGQSRFSEGEMKRRVFAHP
jgi:hypothetical protein